MKATLWVCSLVLLVLISLPAQGCDFDPPWSVAQALALEELDEDEGLMVPVRSVYELAPIAEVPSFGLVTGEAVLAITRYWGEEPPELDRRDRAGGVFVPTNILNSCGFGPHMQPIGYYAVTEWEDGSEHERWIWPDRVSERDSLGPHDLALLDNALGPPTEVEIPFTDRVSAYPQLLWWRLPLASAVAYVLWRWWSRLRHMSARAEPDQG